MGWNNGIRNLKVMLNYAYPVCVLQRRRQAREKSLDFTGKERLEEGEGDWRREREREREKKGGKTLWRGWREESAKKGELHGACVGWKKSMSGCGLCGARDFVAVCAKQKGNAADLLLIIYQGRPRKASHAIILAEREFGACQGWRRRGRIQPTQQTLPCRGLPFTVAKCFL